MLVSLLRKTVGWVCVLEDRGVLDAMRQGIRLVRAHLVDVDLMWLLTIGVRILIVLDIPITIAGVLLQSTLSTTWALTYRAMQAVSA